MSHVEWMEILLEAEPLYKDVLKTEIAHRFGFHQIKDAVEYYKNNATSGKVLLKPALTPPVPTKRAKL